MAPPRSHSCTIRGPALADLHTLRNCSIPADRPALYSFYGSLSLTPMSLLAPEKAVQALLHRVVPQLSIERIEPVPSARVQQIYLVYTGDGNRLLLKLPPPADVRPLRCEREGIASEVALLAWLDSSPSQIHAEAKSARDNSKRNSSNYCHESDTPVNANEYLRTYDTRLNYLNGFAPTAKAYGPPSSDGSSAELLLSDPPPGTILSDMQSSLSSGEQKTLQWETGHFLRRIACHVSPTRCFGYAVDVLRSNPNMQVATTHDTSTTPPSHSGYAGWSQAFHLLLESVLRDMEDTCVQVAYGQVRAHFERLRHILDYVKRPSLVAIECDDTTVLVSTAVERGTALHPKSRSIDKTTNHPSPREYDTTREHVTSGVREIRQPLKITGLRDWGDCIFGDPLIAIMFSQSPSQNFLDGFETPLSHEDPFGETAVIEDSSHAHARLALYQCYHALCGVAKQYRRPRDPEVDMELHWRKRLHEALRTLSTIDDEGNTTVSED